MPKARRVALSSLPLMQRTTGFWAFSELLVNNEKTGPVPVALMSLNKLIETEGRNYTPAEYSAWLKEAGVAKIRTVGFEAAGANGAVIGFKP